MRRESGAVTPGREAPRGSEFHDVYKCGVFFYFESIDRCVNARRCCIILGSSRVEVSKLLAVRFYNLYQRDFSPPRTRAKTRSAPLVVSYSQQRRARAKNPLMAETRRATSMSARETPTARMGATTSMNIITLEATDEDSAVRASTPLSALCRAVPFRRSRELSALFLLHAHFRSLPTGPRRRSPDLPSPAPNSRPTRALS